jgi:hypothetical protein
MKRSSSVSYGTTCPFCRSSQSCRSLVSEMRTAPSFSAAVHADPIPAMSPDPVAHELHNFPSVFARHLRLGAFDVRLSRAASKGIFHKLHDERLCRILHLMAPAVDAFLSAIARGHWKPGSPWVICTSLRSYLRFQPLRGDDIRLVVQHCRLSPTGRAETAQRTVGYPARTFPASFRCQHRIRYTRFRLSSLRP